MKKTEKKAPKISIIVPVYNVQGYLGKCLKSLMKQTLKDIEIICVNDGSTDDSLSILNFFALNDKRVKVVNQENSGPGIARNKGIKKAKGEYIGFVDPDDWIKEDMYEKMYNQAKKLDSEIVICNYTSYQEWNSRVVTQDFFQKAVKYIKSENLDIKEGKNINREYILQTLLVSPCYVWNRIYKRSLITKSGIQFSNNMCYEDCPFIIKSHILAQKISYIDYVGYIYLLRKKSLVRSNNYKFLDFFKATKEIAEFLSTQNLSDRLALNVHYFKVMNLAWTYNGINNEGKISLLKQAKKFLTANEYAALKKKLQIRWKDKLKKFLSKYISITELPRHKVFNFFTIKLKLKRRYGQLGAEQCYINKIRKNCMKYPKDTYLLYDCLHDETAEAIDAYSLFEEMRKHNIPAYYAVREQTTLYKTLLKDKKIENIIPLTFSPRTHPYEFIKKVYPVLLRTKCILTAFGENSGSTDSFFKKYSAWKYIFIQHGPTFLKESVFLNGYIRPEKYDYILVCSQVEYNLFKKYGFPEEQLLICGLPRWDLLPKRNYSHKKEILMLFTWRRMQNILFDETLYKKNLFRLIRNEKLKQFLKQENITLYFAPHHALLYHAHTNFNVSSEKNIKIIDSGLISQYIRSCSCLITDFSSVSFDFMFQNKPVLFYVPDRGDATLGTMDREDLRRFNYKQDVLPNVFFDENAVVERLIKYCKNDFKIDATTKKIYDSFFYTKENIREQLIEKLENICPTR